MPKLVCNQCGADYPADWAKAWGKHYETHGAGPQMVCTALVPNGNVAPLPDNQTEEQCPMDKRIAKGACGGLLVPVSGTLAEGRPTWPA